MKDIKNYINESFINEGITGQTKTAILDMVKELEEYLSQIMPSLNNKWKNYFKPKFESSDLNEIYDDNKDVSLKEWKGYNTKYNGWQSGVFDRWKSCYRDDIKETIKNLNNDYDEKYQDNNYYILFSTCCEYLEGCGYDDPLVEWTKRDFMYAATAMEFVINKLK